MDQSLGLRLIDVEVNLSGKVVKEVSVCKSSGTVYYFEITDNSIISMDMLSSGKVNAYMRDVAGKTAPQVIDPKDGSSEKYYASSFNVKGCLDTDAMIKYLTDLSNSLQSGQVALSQVSIDHLGVAKSAASPPKSAITTNIVGMLEDLLGNEVSNDYLYGETYRNEDGELYYSTDYSSGHNISFSLLTGSSLTAVGVATGFPPSTIIGGLLILFELVQGVYEIISDYTSYEYYALVTHEKQGYVNSQEWHTSTKYDYRYVLAYNSSNMTDFKDGSSVSSTSTSVDYNYSYSYHVREAIDNYLENQI